MRKKVLAGVFIVLASLVGLTSTGAAAQQGSEWWSVAVHIRYPNGFVYDHVFATGVSTEDLPSILQDCGSSHWVGSPIQYHCYAIPE